MLEDFGVQFGARINAVLVRVRSLVPARSRMAVTRVEPWWRDAVRRRQLIQAASLLGLGGVIFFFVLAGMAWVMRPDALPVKRVEVTGSFAGVQRAELAAVASDVARGNFFMADLAKARRQFAGLPWVDSVAVRRVWPDVLQVAVTEHESFARWADGGLVNVRGQLFFPDEKTYPKGMPVFSGPVGTAKLVADQYRKAVTQIKSLGVQIVEFGMDERHAWSFRLDNGMVIVLGQQHVDTRIARFVRAYPRALAPYSNVITRVDLRYPNGFAVKWKSPANVAGASS